MNPKAIRRRLRARRHQIRKSRHGNRPKWKRVMIEDTSGRVRWR